jgi:hypothetical protein
MTLVCLFVLLDSAYVLLTSPTPNTSYLNSSNYHYARFVSQRSLDKHTGKEGVLTVSLSLSPRSYLYQNNLLFTTRLATGFPVSFRTSVSTHLYHHVRLSLSSLYLCSRPNLDSWSTFLLPSLLLAWLTLALIRSLLPHVVHVSDLEVQYMCPRTLYVCTLLFDCPLSVSVSLRHCIGPYPYPYIYM